MADIIITPLPGKIDFFTNKGDNSPINGVKLLGSNLVFYGPISASSVLTNGGGRYVTTTSPTINYVPKFNSNSSIANSLIFDSGTNVGIGTNKPSASLQVISSTSGATLLRADGTSGTLFSVVDDLTDSLMSVNNSAGLPVFEVFADDRIVAGQYGVNDFVLTNNRVGIGTNNPIGKLHVTGSTSTPAGIFLGDVGIGTTSFVYSNANRADVEIYGTTDALLALRNATANSYIHKTGNDFYINNGGAGNLVLQNNSSERMRINSSGNVGIGTSSPSHLLTLSRATQTTAYQLNFNTDGGITDGNYTGIRFSQGAGGGTELGNIRLTYFTTGATALSLGVRNAAQAVYIGTDGNVGISNTNPTSKLYIEGGSANWSLPNPGTSVGTIHLDPGSTTDNFGNAITFGASDSANGETAQAGIYVRSDGGYGTVIYLATTDDYNTGSKVRFTVGNNGNIGIATTAPAYRLDINGITRFQNIIRLKNDGWNLTDEGQVRFYFDTSGRTYFGSGNGYEWRSVADAALMVLTNAGNVGIGTTSPVAKLDINGTSNFAPNVYHSIGGQKFFAGSGGAFSYIYTGTTALNFINGSDTSTLMSLLNNGNLGIGTTTPAYKFHIYSGSMYVQGGAGASVAKNYTSFSRLIFDTDHSDSARGPNKITLYDSGGWVGGLGVSSNVVGYYSGGNHIWHKSTSQTAFTEYMRLDSNGNLGIGTSIPNSKLFVSAGTLASSQRAAYISADITTNTTVYTHTLNLIDSSADANTTSLALGTYSHVVFRNRAVTAGSEGGILDIYTRDVAGNPTVKMTVTNTGNVGIGTTSPIAKLHTVGSNGATDYVYQQWSYINNVGVYDLILKQTVTTNVVRYNFSMINNSTAYNDVLVLDRGCVGIGTTFPGYKLDVSGTFNVSGTSTLAGVSVSGTINSSATEAIRINNNNGYISFYNTAGNTRTGYLQGNSGNDILLASENGAVIRFAIGGSERVRIDTSGNVGIGTTSPGAKLAIIGNRLTDPNNDAQSREIYYAVSRTVATAAGSTTLLGYLTPTSRSDNAVIEIYHHDCGTIEYVRFVVNSVYYTGATTDWVQLPSISNLSYSGALDGCTVDARMSSNFGNIELRLRSLGGSCADMAVFVSIKTNCLFTSQTTTGTGGTVAGLLCNNAYQFPVGANRFEGTRNRGLYIINSGNVGINTQSPSAMLHVSGSTAGDEVFVGTISDNQIVGGRTGGSFGIATKTASNGNLILTANANIYLRSGGSNDRVFVKSDGNVGIGNLTPQTKLEVSGETMVNYTNAIITVQGGSGYGLIRMYGNNSSVEMQMDSHASNANAGTLGTYTNHPVYIKTNNTTKVSITTSGNVGIGTTSPSATLTVIATNNTGSRIQLGTAANNTFMDANKVNDFMILTAPFNSNPASVANAGAKWGIKLNGSIDTINTKAKSAAIYAVSEDTLAGYNRQVGLALHTSGFDLENTERVRISNTGNVGIGVTTPRQILHVNGSILLDGVDNGYTQGATRAIGYGSNSGGTSTNGFSGMDIQSVSVVGNYSQNVRFWTHHYGQGSGGTPRMVIQYDGNIGIGTTSPSVKLAISDGTTIAQVNPYAGVAYFGTVNNYPMALSVNSSEKVRIAADGNVGIGTTSPAAKLDVNGSAIIRGTLSSDSSRVAVYTTLTGVSGNWFPLFQINDAVDGTVLCNIKTFAHSSVTFTAAKGYSPSQTHVITILNSQQNANGGYANIVGVRIRESGFVEIQLSWASGPAVDISVQLIGTSYTPTFAASLAATTAVDTIVDSVALQSGLIRTKRNMVADGYVTGGSVGAGISAPTSILHVRASAPGSVGTAPTGTNVLIDSNTSNYITFRNTADNGTYAGLAFLDNNVGGYIVFRNYTGDVTTGSDSMIYGTYQDHIFQNSASETINGKTETMRIKSNGSVGIGTNNPGYKLDVNGTFRSTGDLYTNGNIVISRAGAYLYINGTNSDAEIIWQTNGSNRWAAGMNVGDATENFNVYNYTTATTNLTILKANGNVGIGSTAPAYKLDVNGVIASSGSPIAWFSGNYNRIFEPAGNPALYLGNNSDPANYYDNTTHYFRNRGGSSNYAIINSSGNLGIGTTIVTSPLTVYNNADVWHFRLGSSAGELRFGGATNNGAVIQAYTPAGVVRDLYIQRDGGNVGIGTNSPGGKLHVIGEIISLKNGSNSQTTQLYLANASNTRAYNVQLNSAGSNLALWGYNSSNVWQNLVNINYNGNVGVGTTTPSASLHTVSSTAGATLLRADGTSGTLFSVVDDLTDSLMSVNNSAGLPVFEVFADDRIVGGQYGTNDFVITNNRVGIGTSNPLAKLHVTGSTSVPAAVFLGDVGVGTTAPTNQTNYRFLQVNGPVSAIIETMVGGSRIGGFDSTANILYVGTIGSYPIVFRTAVDEKMRISANGNVGIGTTSPGSKLDVNGTFRTAINNLTIFNDYIYVSPTENNTLNSAYFTNGIADMWINYAGYNNGNTQFRNFNVGNGKNSVIAWFDGTNKRMSINNGQAASYTLDVNGSIRTTSKFVQNSTTVSVSGTGQTLTLNLDTAAVYVVSMASGATITTISYSNRDNNPAVNTIMLVVKYAGTASITFTNVIWANGVAPTLTGTNGYADVFMLTSYQGGAGTPVWIGTVVSQALVSTNL